MQEPEFYRRAQTNTQLYRQLLAAGYAGNEVRRVHEAYTLATKLFAGQLRPEGRPFVCHLVGVASILAMVEAPLETIIAGLLHSAYSHGDFGRGPGQVTDAARGWLRAAVGAQTERFVASYASHPWNKSSLAGLLANATALDPDLRPILLIRLTDAIEDALDHGLQLSQKASNSNRDISGEDLFQLANVLGFPTLGALSKRLLDSAEIELDISALRSGHAGSYIVCPSSWRKKILPRVTRFMLRGRA
jgi:hypothetical protein